MIDAGKNQVMGHMFQTLLDGAFQYGGGLGRDGRASGIVLTMASAELFALKISNVGTQNINLTSQRTGNHPLFSKTTTNVLFKGARVEDSLNKSDLVFVDPPGGAVMQKGFVNLAYFVMDLGNKEVEGQGNAKIKLKDATIELKKFLGAGAFCSVHEAHVSGDDDAKLVVKIAKDKKVSCEALMNELSVLQALNHSSIPRLYSESLVDLEIQQRCERNWVKGLILRARVGVTAGKYFKTADPLMCIDWVVTKTIAALEHAHERGVIHMDVQPSNIIILPGVDGNLTVLLIDWGCGALRNKNLTYYKGCPPFSHDDLLYTAETKIISKKPLPEYDEFSLAMTICSRMECRGMALIVHK